MKKNILLAVLLSAGFLPVYAQEADDQWTVFETASKQETTFTPSYLVPASVVADDDREEITGQAKGLEKAVVVLEMTTEDGNVGLCSGSMVGPNIVLTAAHCLSYQGNFMQNVRVFAVGMPSSGGDSQTPPDVNNPSQPPSNPSQRDIDDILRQIPNFPINRNEPRHNDIFRKIVGALRNKKHNSSALAQHSDLDDILKKIHQGNYPSASSKKLWVPNEYIRLTRNKRGNNVDLEKEELFDYGIIVLDNSLGNQTGWLGLTVKSSQELKNAPIVVVGRGGDKPARSLWEARGRIGQVHRRYFFHNADQVGGNSGGPILDMNNRNKIIGLANFGDGRHRVPNGYPNGGLRITDSIVRVVNQAS